MNPILVPIDFSAVTSAVVREATKLARLAKARVVLLHAVQAPVAAADYGLLADVGFYLIALEKAADRRLAAVQARLRGEGIRAETLRYTGFPTTGILAEAKKRSAAYIVLGSHGHTAFHDLLLGSTASGVLKRATCPVVVVPAPQKRPARFPRARR
jgi:nucleotide-binding universal stress UspA family protein